MREEGVGEGELVVGFLVAVGAMGQGRILGFGTAVGAGEGEVLALTVASVFGSITVLGVEGCSGCFLIRSSSFLNLSAAGVDEVRGVVGEEGLGGLG